MSVLFARSETGRVYFLTVQRPNVSSKWPGSLMFGPAETLEVNKGESYNAALIRGLKEELGIDRSEVKNVTPYSKAFDPSNVSDSKNYRVKFYAVEVSMAVLKKARSEVLAGKWPELKGARIVRRLGSLRDRKMNIYQPIKENGEIVRHEKKVGRLFQPHSAHMLEPVRSLQSQLITKPKPLRVVKKRSKTPSWITRPGFVKGSSRKRTPLK